MHCDIVQKKLLTLRAFSLFCIRRVSRYPAIVVCLEMGTLVTLGEGASQSGSPRARGSKDVDAVDHGATPLRLGDKCRHAALQYRFERLNFIEGKAACLLMRRLLHHDRTVLHRLELE